MKNHHESFSNSEKGLLSIIRSLQEELVVCQNELQSKNTLLMEARDQLHDLWAWGQCILDEMMRNRHDDENTSPANSDTEDLDAHLMDTWCLPVHGVVQT